MSPPPPPRPGEHCGGKNLRAGELGIMLCNATFWTWHDHGAQRLTAVMATCMGSVNNISQYSSREHQVNSKHYIKEKREVLKFEGDVLGGCLGEE